LHEKNYRLTFVLWFFHNSIRFKVNKDWIREFARIPFFFVFSSGTLFFRLKLCLRLYFGCLKKRFNPQFSKVKNKNKLIRLRKDLFFRSYIKKTLYLCPNFGGAFSIREKHKKGNRVKIPDSLAAVSSESITNYEFLRDKRNNT
jgi:hypothetical protein